MFHKIVVVLVGDLQELFTVGGEPGFFFDNKMVSASRMSDALDSEARAADSLMSCCVTQPALRSPFPKRLSSSSRISLPNTSWSNRTWMLGYRVLMSTSSASDSGRTNRRTSAFPVLWGEENNPLDRVSHVQECMRNNELERRQIFFPRRGRRGQLLAGYVPAPADRVVAGLRRGRAVVPLNTCLSGLQPPCKWHER